MNTLKIWRLSSLLGIGLLFSACAGLRQAQQPQIIYPTVVLVQYVTQVVATVTPAPPQPAAPPHPANAQPTQAAQYVTGAGYNPYSAPLYYPLPGCLVASRLHIGDVAFVAYNDALSGLHASEDIGSAPLLRKLENGEQLDITKGPYCQRGALVWQVKDGNKKTGYVAEGDGSIYWLLPYSDQNDPELVAKAGPHQNPPAFKIIRRCGGPR